MEQIAEKKHIPSIVLVWEEWGLSLDRFDGLLLGF